MATPNDDQIGKNLSILRGDMTQQELGERMRDRGFKWSQATVWDVERGKRPLRLTESLEVIAILKKPGVTIESLWAVDNELQIALDLQDAYKSVAKSWEAIKYAISEFRRSKDAWLRVTGKAAELNIAPRMITIRRQGKTEPDSKFTSVVSGSDSPAGSWLARDPEVQKMTLESAIHDEAREHDQKPSESEIEAAGDWYESMHSDELRGK